MDCIKLKCFGTSKETITRMDNPQNGRKIVTNYLLDKGIVSGTYKELKRLSVKRANNPINKWAIELVLKKKYK
jgi:hypothetical protein